MEAAIFPQGVARALLFPTIRIITQKFCVHLSVHIYLTSWEPANKAMLLRISDVKLQNSSLKIFVLLKFKLIYCREYSVEIKYELYIYIYVCVCVCDFKYPTQNK